MMTRSQGREGNIFRWWKHQSRDEPSKGEGYMRISARIQSVMEQEGDLCKKPKNVPRWWSEADTHWVGVGYTLAMLCHVAKIWNGQDNGWVGLASRISTTSGSYVTLLQHRESEHNTFLFGCVYYKKSGDLWHL
jgi:hypothetical protein